VDFVVDVERQPWKANHSRSVGTQWLRPAYAAVSVYGGEPASISPSLTHA
jgi:hypothetical protein